MNTIEITAKKDFLKQISAAPGLRALAELIWNGFDSGASRVEVSLRTNELGGLEEVRVKDNGSGINREHVKSLFGNLGESWKRDQPRLHNRFLHGKNGRGRFKGFAIGEFVEWRSCYHTGAEHLHYQISGTASSLEALEFTDPQPAEVPHTGTEVIISQIRGTFGSLLSENAPAELAKLFAVYLSQYPALELVYQGVKVRPDMVRQLEELRVVPDVVLDGERSSSVDVYIHEWNMNAKRGIHLCDEHGHLLHEVEVGSSVRAPGYFFTVKACSARFRELDEENRLGMGELDPDVAKLVAPVREEIRAYFKERVVQDRHARVVEWLEEGTHPFPDLPAEAPQRQAFEKLATHLDDAGAGIRKLDPATRLLNFHLLGTVLVHHPEGINNLVDELFPMKKGERRALETLLA